MKIEEFLRAYENHPVLFVGTGISLRYLRNSYTWDGLLKKISADLYSNRDLCTNQRPSLDTNFKLN
ncbi:hypothetical protein I6J32_06265 [Moraxella osloensis]|nr:hypothetical protein [Moraxella osloensis]QRO14413.1 hypothetical protein I6J32_06265 [Moraxella osloensis]